MIKSHPQKTVSGWTLEGHATVLNLINKSVSARSHAEQISVNDVTIILYLKSESILYTSSLSDTVPLSALGIK